MFIKFFLDNPFNLYLLLALLILVLIYLMIKRSFRKKKINSEKKEPELTDEFKAMVKGINLDLADDKDKIQNLIEIEETLKALKELYDKKYITEEEYVTRSTKITDALKK